MLKMLGPNPSYSSTVASFPTGLCSNCNHALYKIKAGKPEASWGGPHPPSWTNFSADSIHGVRTCGTLLDGQEEQVLCDICKHIRNNRWPKGAVGRKVELDKFKSRGCDKDTNKNNCKNVTKNSW